MSYFSIPCIPPPTPQKNKTKHRTLKQTRCHFILMWFCYVKFDVVQSGILYLAVKTVSTYFLKENNRYQHLTQIQSLSPDRSLLLLVIVQLTKLNNPLDRQKK